MKSRNAHRSTHTVVVVIVISRVFVAWGNIWEDGISAFSATSSFGEQKQQISISYVTVNLMQVFPSPMLRTVFQQRKKSTSSQRKNSQNFVGQSIC